MKAEEYLNTQPKLKTLLEKNLVRGNVTSLMQEYAELYHQEQTKVSDEEIKRLTDIIEEYESEKHYRGISKYQEESLKTFKSILKTLTPTKDSDKVELSDKISHINASKVFLENPESVKMVNKMVDLAYEKEENTSDKGKKNVKCKLCSRAFIGKMPHKCNDGYRKRNIIWEDI